MPGGYYPDANVSFINQKLFNFNSFHFLVCLFVYLFSSQSHYQVPHPNEIPQNYQPNAVPQQQYHAPPPQNQQPNGQYQQPNAIPLNHAQNQGIHQEQMKQQYGEQQRQQAQQNKQMGQQNAQQQAPPPLHNSGPQNPQNGQVNNQNAPLPVVQQNTQQVKENQKH